MSDTTNSRAFNWFTPWRFAVLLALFVFAAFPQVLLGMQTFVVRDYGFYSYPTAFFQQQCYQHGELPFWNPYNYCGVPFLAQWNTMRSTAGPDLSRAAADVVAVVFLPAAFVVRGLWDVSPRAAMDEQ